MQPLRNNYSPRPVWPQIAAEALLYLVLLYLVLAYQSWGH